MKATLPADQESLALSHYPFEGDYTDVSGLSDKMVNGRGAYECFQCCDAIEPGERHRALAERNNEERKVETFRFCGACCETFAILEGPEGDDEPMMVRYEQGRRVRDARRVSEKKAGGCGCHLCKSAQAAG